MAAMRRMLCKPDHETHDFRGSSDRCYRMTIETYELLYSYLAFDLTMTYSLSVSRAGIIITSKDGDYLFCWRLFALVMLVT